MDTMKTEYTAGPWQVVSSEHYQTIRNEKHVIADMRFAGGAVINSHDAALIASAPDMLEALQLLVSAANCNYERNTMEYEGMFDKARAAIHKATGGATPCS